MKHVRSYDGEHELYDHAVQALVEAEIDRRLDEATQEDLAEGDDAPRAGWDPSLSDLEIHQMLALATLDRVRLPRRSAK